MTYEDEEFNRIEMESRIKQEYIRAMRKTTREEKISRPAVYEVPANNRMIASHQDHVRRLMEELAIARACIRELGDRLAKLEKTEPVKMLEYICLCGKGMRFESKDGIVAPQGTWVGLTDEEIFTELERVDPETKRLPAGLKIFAHYLEARLKEKNNAS